MPASKKQEQLESKRKDSKSEGTKTKKSKKIKSKKLSDDAKSRQQEQRAAVEEERRRLREELINSFLKHKLQKEQQLTTLNQAKLIDKWRTVLRESKCQELSQELEIHKANFSKRYKANLQEIDYLIEQLDELGHDYCRLTEDHKKATLDTFGVHVSRLSSLDVIFEQEREFISSTIDNDYDSAIEIHREEKRSLLNTIQSVKTHYHDSYNMQRNYFQAIKDDIINQGLEEVQTLRINLERRLGQKWQQLYESCTENGELDEQRWILYSKLKMKDEVALRQQCILTHRLEQLSLTTDLYRQKIRNSNNNWKLKQRPQLLQLKNELHDRRERWRLNLFKQQQHHIDLLKAIAYCSSETTEFLENLVRQGLGILRSAKRCRQLKPIYDHMDAFENSEHEPAGWTHFHHFWTRFNKAYLEAVLLERHHSQLVRDQCQRGTTGLLIDWNLCGKTLEPISRLPKQSTDMK